MFSSLRKCIVSLVHLVHLGGAWRTTRGECYDCLSLTFSRFQGWAQIKHIQDWVWCVFLEYAMSTFPQSELGTGPEHVTVICWSQRGHEGARSGNRFASLALVKCTRNNFELHQSMPSRRGESSTFCLWSSAAFRSLSATWCSLFVISNTIYFHVA